MWLVLRGWTQRYFSDPQAVALLAILATVFGLLFLMSSILMPILISIVVAYVLQWMSRGLEKLGVYRSFAVAIVYTGFLSLFLLMLFIVTPIVCQQLSHLFSVLPNMTADITDFLAHMPEKLAHTFPKENMEQLIQEFMIRVRTTGEDLLSASISHLPSLIFLLVYLFIVPFLVFFFLKDQQVILSWFGQFLPHERKFLQHIWDEVNDQLGNYIRGKLAEIFIVTIATGVVFFLMHMPYALLLAGLVGLSVVVPYVGFVIVTIPVVLVAFMAWGFTPHCFYTLLLYGIVQAIDANIVVPVLFSEAVNLHPAVIMIAIIVFGGWWGIWGVFFAIPLATLIKAIVSAWPSRAIGRR